MAEDGMLHHHLRSRLTRYEAGLYQLIRDIRELMPQVTREQAKLAAAKVELAAGAIERLMRTGGEEEGAYSEIYAASDQLILLKAEFERKLRGVMREEEDLELKRERQKTRQLREEIEREMGGALGEED